MLDDPSFDIIVYVHGVEFPARHVGIIAAKVTTAARLSTYKIMPTDVAFLTAVALA